MTFEKVMKFGGAALADGAGVERACRIVREHGGSRPIVVVSAHQGVTSLLELLANQAAEGRVDLDRVRIRHKTILRQLGLDPELLDRYFAELHSLLGGIARRRALELDERDLVLSHGERMSARVVARALAREGFQATPIDAFDLGLTTDSNHGAARPLPESRPAVREALLQVSGIPVVTGFLAKDREGNLTTLGRNGSDLTAAVLAEAAGARELELWKTVDGMMTADPAIVPRARRIGRLSFVQAGELAFHGADVLHPGALAPALRAGVAVKLLDVRDPNGPGTVLAERSFGDEVVGIAARRRLVRIRLEADDATECVERLGELAEALAHARAEPAALVSGSAGVDAFVVPGPACDVLLRDIGRDASVERDLALVALVGSGPDEAGDASVDRAGDPHDDRRGDAGSSAAIERALGALASAGVRPREAFLGAERASQLFILRAEDLEAGVRALHAELFEGAHVRIP